MSAKSVRRAILIIAIIAVAVWLLHGPFLQYVAALLIVDQPDGDYQSVCIVSRLGWPMDDEIYDTAAELHRANPSCKMLLVGPPANRMNEIGIVPTFEKISRRELAVRGVPESSISVIHGKKYGFGAAIQAIQPQLNRHPRDSAVFLCGRFESAQMRFLLDRILEPDQADRVKVHCIPSKVCDETNWWKSRGGYKSFGGYWLRQLFQWCGGGWDAPTCCSADDYERKVLESFSEDTP